MGCPRHRSRTAPRRWSWSAGWEEPWLRARTVMGRGRLRYRGPVDDHSAPVSLILPPGGASPAESALEPESFRDLHLDRIVASLVAGRAEYHLEPLLYAPLKTADAVGYRHEVLRDLERSGSRRDRWRLRRWDASRPVRAAANVRSSPAPAPDRVPGSRRHLCPNRPEARGRPDHGAARVCGADRPLGLRDRLRPLRALRGTGGGRRRRAGGSAWGDLSPPRERPSRDRQPSGRRRGRLRDGRGRGLHAVPTGRPQRANEAGTRARGTGPGGGGRRGTGRTAVPGGVRGSGRLLRAP